MREFDEKKFWIALFSIMAEGEAAKSERDRPTLCAICWFLFA